MARAIATARAGFRRIFAISTFAPPPPLAAAAALSCTHHLVSDSLCNSILNQSNTNSFSRLYGSCRLFSISAFSPPPPATPAPKADPSCNLFVSGLSKRTTSEGLREAFEKFGQVVHARVVTDRVSGYSKGFGFVRYATLEEAAKGQEGMDGKFLDGWVIFAEYARPRPPPSAQQPQTSEPSSGYQPSQSPNSYQSQSGYGYQSSQPGSEPPYNYQSPSYQSSQTGSEPPHNYQSPSYQSSQSSSEPPYNYQSPSGYQTSQTYSDYQPPSAYQSAYQPAQPSPNYQSPSQPPESQSTYHPYSGYQPTYPSSDYQPPSNYQTPTGYQNPQPSVDYQTPLSGNQTYQPTHQNSSGYQNAPANQTTEACSGNQNPSGYHAFEASA